MNEGEFEFDIWVPKAGAQKEEEANSQKKKSVQFANKNKLETLQSMDVDSEEDESDDMLQMVFMRQV